MIIDRFSGIPIVSAELFWTCLRAQHLVDIEPFILFANVPQQPYSLTNEDPTQSPAEPTAIDECTSLESLQVFNYRSEASPFFPEENCEVVRIDVLQVTLLSSKS